MSCSCSSHSSFLCSIPEFPPQGKKKAFAEGRSQSQKKINSLWRGCTIIFLYQLFIHHPETDLFPLNWAFGKINNQINKRTFFSSLFAPLVYFYDGFGFLAFKNVGLLLGQTKLLSCWSFYWTGLTSKPSSMNRTPQK